MNGTMASQSSSMPESGQASRQLLQAIQTLYLISAVLSRSDMAETGQESAQLPQTVQLVLMKGLAHSCCSSLPGAAAQPMARFLIAPPNPLIPWPLK